VWFRLTDGEIIGTITGPGGELDELHIRAPSVEAGEWPWIFLGEQLKGAKQGGLGVVNLEDDK
jgi:hypothetical protein